MYIKKEGTTMEINRKKFDAGRSNWVHDYRLSIVGQE